MIQLYIAIAQILTCPPSSPPMTFSFLDLQASLYLYLTYSLIDLKLKQDRHCRNRRPEYIRNYVKIMS